MNNYWQKQSRNPVITMELVKDIYLRDMMILMY